MEIISNIPFDLDVGSLAVKAYVGADADDAREFEALVNEARRQARPKVIYKECFIGRFLPDDPEQNGLGHLFPNQGQFSILPALPPRKMPRPPRPLQ